MTAVAALATAAWLVSAAAAGNPHGTPPGQQKKSDSATVNAHASVHGNAGAKVHGNGHASVHGNAGAKAHGNGHANVQASGSVNGNGHANGLAKVHANGSAKVHGNVSAGTSGRVTLAAASSTETKVYGNGSTAGQIAMQSGLSGNAMLFGPGNSRPHKVLCGSTMVDVHALKAHATACGVNGSTSVKVHGRGSIFAEVGLNVAAASSNQTKVYGNGSTAGEIAMQAGLPATTVLYGPGNSRPHKVLIGGKLVDVHAIKAAIGSSSQTGSAAGVAGSTSTQASVTAGAAAHAGIRAANASSSSGKASSGGGVLGATAQLASSARPVGSAVLSTASSSTLPFTGLALWLPAAIGLALILAGFGLRRRARTIA